MSGGYGLHPGASLLGRAIGHAAFLYGDQPGDYDDILAAAVRARRARPGYSRDTLRGYAAGRARDLIAQARSGQLDHDDKDMARWIGSATVILEELTRDA